MKRSFDSSVAFCQGLGMDLIIPTSSIQSIAIANLLYKHGIRSDGAWFSKADLFTCDFKYANGSSVDFLGWADGQPNDCNGGIETCAFVPAGNIGGSGKWYDEWGCGPEQYTVCQSPGIKILNHLSIQMDNVKLLSVLSC